MYLHITHTEYHLSKHSYAKPPSQLKEVIKEIRGASESVVCLLQSYGSTNRGSGLVCLFAI
jgi:hypothetical protein